MELHHLYLVLGGLCLVGLATDAVARRSFLPRVTLLLVFGFLCGPSATGLLGDLSQRWFTPVAEMALVLVGFLLGGTLTIDEFRRHGRAVLAVSVAVVIATVAVVTLGLIGLGAPIVVAAVLGVCACATDPAATADVIHAEGAGGPFTRRLTGIVAIDDAWGLIAFSVVIAVLGLANGGTGLGGVWHCLWELGGSILLGLVLGVPMAYLSGRIRPGEPIFAEAVGMILVCIGLSLWLEVSSLAAAMVMGVAVTNLARHHRRPFHAIEGIEWPFMIVFFVLAGASFDLASLAGIGAIGAGFLVLRVVGRLVGAWAGGALAGIDIGERWWLGASLLPQAGVAIGMALVAARHYPEHAEAILNVVIGGTVVIELVGPIVIRIALRRLDEGGVPARVPAIRKEIGPGLGDCKQDKQSNLSS